MDGKVDFLEARFDSFETGVGKRFDRFELFETGVGQRFEQSDLSRDAWLARIEAEVSGVKLSVENVSVDLSAPRAGLGQL